MNCCECQKVKNNCTCAVVECRCKNDFDCWCCLFNHWEKIDNELNISVNYFKYFEDINKMKSIPKLFKKGIRDLIEDLKITETNLNKLNKTNYIEYIDLNYESKKIISIMEEDMISKLIYFINKLEFYIESSIILIEININPDYKISYLELHKVCQNIEDLIPSLVKAFGSIEKTLDNSVEYETLKEKMYIFDTNLINLRSMLDIKILNNR
ncbi:hypothetical protein [Spiroplasma diminutum]|uniref:Uncharacterized protein n=1 Tax=Spiroplasma diminutum CUAS-1 TaxID=1276221 RepID=S5M1S2_9MOLU|nr:hypothetical protein [Spiroplasma diminutum]AGR42017.1 hypothetical protein SDIMI_v3c03130 [Spiroplasma diminutum CUAS-1]